MSFVLTPPVQAAVPVAGSGGDAVRSFPVHRIYCVGRNYAEHAQEMGHSGREPPFFFMKPADAVLPAADGGTGAMAYPSLTTDLHHEVELVVALSQGSSGMSPESALQYVYGYAVGLDMTRRDLQTEAKKAGRPWDSGKAFEGSAPCSPLVPAAQVGHPTVGRIWLSVNGQPRQQGDLSHMIWNVPEIIAHLSRLFVLHPGDLIFTGTPAGVGPVVPGDQIEAGIDGIASLSLRVLPC